MRQLLKIETVLEALGISRGSLYNWIRDADFPRPIKLGSASRWDADDIDLWIDRQKTQDLPGSTADPESQVLGS